MGTPAQPFEGLGDAELIVRVRSGDLEAYGELHARHVEAARRLARTIAPADHELLEAEASARVLVLLEHGEGPDLAFRPFLLRAVTQAHTSGTRAARRPVVVEEERRPGGHASAAVAAAAFASLPEQWQVVLWHLDVERRTPGEVAPLLSLSPGAVTTLAVRARAGLRRSYLARLRDRAVDPVCVRTHDLLVAYLHGACSEADSHRVEAHLDRCRPCTTVAAQLAEVDSQRRRLLAVAVLGAFADAYLGDPETAAALVSTRRRRTAAAPGEHELRAVTGAGAAGLAAALLMVTVLVNLSLVDDPPDDGPLRADRQETPGQRAGAGVEPPLRFDRLLREGDSPSSQRVLARRPSAATLDVVVLPTIRRKPPPPPVRPPLDLGIEAPPPPEDPFPEAVEQPSPAPAPDQPPLPPPPVLGVSVSGGHERDLGTIEVDLRARVDVQVEGGGGGVGPPLEAEVGVGDTVRVRITRG